MTTNKILSLICILFIFGCEQQKESEFTCNYYGLLSSSKTMESLNAEKYKFSSNSEAIKVVDRIVSNVGLARNFEILESSEVDNAAAVVFNEQRYILYNNDFMELANEITNNSWTSISILAHEIGHHLQGHTLSKTGSRPSIELEADKFSGFILAKMGASLQDAQSAVLNLVSEQSSSTHPKRSERLKAIASGFRDGAIKSSSENLTEEQTDKPNISKTSTPKTPVISKSDNSNAFDTRYLGKHLFNAYFMDGFNSFGNATITKNGVNYQISGNQRNKDGDWVKIEGTIKTTSLDEFTFIGTITGYNPSGAELHNKYAEENEKLSNECSWTGTAKFKRLSKNRKYWRMQKAYQKCYPLIGDVDLFFN